MEFYTILMRLLIIFLHSHYLCAVFIFCTCYYKELLWVSPDSVWNFGYYKIFCEMLFFPSQIYLKATFYTAQNFLYPLRFFILPAFLLNWNKTCCIDNFFASFVKLLNIRLDECSLLLSHLKSVFLKTVRARVREGAKLYQCFSPGGS